MKGPRRFKTRAEIEPYIRAFIEAVYPEAPDLAIATFSERTMLTDAAARIAMAGTWAESCRSSAQAIRGN